MTAEPPGIPAHEAESDMVWVAAVLGRTPPVIASPGLTAALLATFDAQAARRRLRLFAAWAEAIWPGVPAWAPAMAFAFALAIGIGAGAVLSSQAAAQDNQDSAAFSLEAPSSFDLATSDDATEDM